MRKVVAALVVGALALSACSKDDRDRAVQTIEPVVEATEYVCDLRRDMKPAELALSDVLDAVDKGCEWLAAGKATGILPSAPAGDVREVCAVLAGTSITKGEGYFRLCNKNVNKFRSATTAYEEAAARLFPSYEAFLPLIAFNTANTDSLVCGEEAVTGISMCERELYLRPLQLLNYSNVDAAISYAACHEVGHRIQWQVENAGQFGLLTDYAENQAFRETQADCICGGLDHDLGAKPEEVADFVGLMTDIGDLITHGTAEERTGEYTSGIEGGVSACLAKKPSETQT